MLIVGLALLAGGCKPTEKNYQAAYDVAQKRKQAEKSDPDLNLPEKGLQRLDAPAQREVNGEKINVTHIFFKYIGKAEQPQIRAYNVAVAKYKMPTNVRAHAEDLAKQNYVSFPVEGSDGYFYVIAASLPTMEEAVSFMKEYMKKHTPEQLVGLDGSPLIIEK